MRDEIGDSELVVVDREHDKVCCVAHHVATDIVGNTIYVMEESHFKKTKRGRRKANKELQQFGYVRRNGGFHWIDSNPRKAS